jgi:hypothetical protein
VVTAMVLTGRPVLDFAIWGVPAMIIAWLSHSVLYGVVPVWRLLAEVDAYRVQMHYPAADGVPISLETAAWRLAAPGYKLGLTVDQARALLI